MSQPTIIALRRMLKLIISGEHRTIGYPYGNETVKHALIAYGIETGQNIDAGNWMNVELDEPKPVPADWDLGHGNNHA